MPGYRIIGGAYQQTTGTNSVQWYYENPIGSGITAHMILKFNSTGPCRLQARSLLTSLTGGTSKAPINTESSYIPKILVKIGGTASGGTLHDVEGYVDRGQSFEYSAPFVLPEGTNVLFIAIPETTSTSITSVNLIASWREN